MRYWIFASVFVMVVLGLMVMFGCASPNLTEEQRMARLRMAAQLLSVPAPSQPLLMPPSMPSMDRCTTTFIGNVANTVCR